MAPSSTVAYSLYFFSPLHCLTASRIYTQHDARIFGPTEGRLRAVPTVSSGSADAAGTTSAELNILQCSADGAHQTACHTRQISSIRTLYVQNTGHKCLAARRCRNRALTTQGTAAARDVRGRQGTRLLGQLGDAGVGGKRGRTMGTSYTAGVNEGSAQCTIYPASNQK